MKKSKTFWALLIVGLLCIIGIAYMFVGPSEPMKSETPKNTTQLVEFKGADIHEEKDGKIVWLLRADKIMYNPTTKDVFLVNARAEFYQDGTILKIDAPKASVTKNQTFIELNGNVFAKNNNGVEFKGKNLVYDAKSQTMSTKDSFTYKDKGTTITGDTLTGNMVLQQIQAKGHVKVVEE